MYIEIKKLQLLERKDEYPEGANSPTIVTEYRCLCKEGKLVEYNTVGFNDHFVTLECKKCLRKFQPYVDIVGNSFKLYPKK